VNTESSTGVGSATCCPSANSPLLGGQVEFRFSFQLREGSKGFEPAESCGRQRASPNVGALSLRLSIIPAMIKLKMTAATGSCSSDSGSRVDAQAEATRQQLRVPWLISSANSTISHAAAKMASSPCSCQNSMSNERSGGHAPPVGFSTKNFQEGSFHALRLTL
jgi:hypothetical protein